MNSSIHDLFNLKGNVAIITGGHAFLGYDMACALAEAGCNIIITSRDLKKAAETSEKLKSLYNVETLGLEFDQCSYEQVKIMAEKAFAWKNHIDILINNAGGGSGKSEGNFFERAPDDIINLINTNLIGALFCCKEVGRYMMKQGSGKIINVGSIAAMVGRDRRMYRETNKTEQPIDYAAAKAGVVGMTRDLAGLLSPCGIHVNSISPGGFNKGESEDFVNAYSDETMLGRMGRMGTDIKGVALFLASPASDYVTGQNIIVDGGFSLWK